MGNRRRARILRRTTTLMVSIGTTAALVAGTAQVNPPVEVTLAADSTALILCGTTCPTPDAFWIDAVKNQFVGPTHPGQDLDYVGVTAPMEFWPVTGLFRIVLLAIGPPELWGPGGPGWPDEPWWKLSGLFDLTANQSLRAGVADLEAAMADNGNDHLVVYGNSQGAGIANVVKKSLAEQDSEGAQPPDIDFVLGGDPNLPNGGLMSRFPGLYIPILDLTFNGAAATDTPFETVEINRQYDGFSDFPLYPLNLIADLNAVLGVFYVHAYALDVSMAADAPTSPTFQGTHGDTSYYFFDTPDLPLFGPLRSLGVPEPLIDVVEPFFRVLVELGYDRSIPPWEPTPARLIPQVNPARVITDLVNAVGEGINNALTLVGAPKAPPTPAVVAATAQRNEEPLAPNETQTIEPTSTVTDSGGPSRRPTSGDSATTTPKQVKPVGRSARAHPARDAGSGRASAKPSAAASTGGSSRRASARGDD